MGTFFSALVHRKVFFCAPGIRVVNFTTRQSRLRTNFAENTRAMRKIVVILFSILFLSAPKMSAQLGFDFGMNFEFMNRKAPEGFKSEGFGMGPYVGVIYGIPVSMKNMIVVGLNYKFDLMYGAMGAWRDEKKLDPITLWNGDTDIREHHLQLPVTFNHSLGRVWNVSAGPVFDYCLSSTIKSTQTDWPFRDENGKAMKVDTVKEFGMKPFNIYLKAGIGTGLKGFSFKITAAYGLLNLMPDNGSPLNRWTAGLDFHIVL